MQECFLQILVRLQNWAYISVCTTNYMISSCKLDEYGKGRLLVLTYQRKYEKSLNVDTLEGLPQCLQSCRQNVTFDLIIKVSFSVKNNTKR